MAGVVADQPCRDSQRSTFPNQTLFRHFKMPLDVLLVLEQAPFQAFWRQHDLPVLGHAWGGALAFLAALIALFSIKGSKGHRRAGHWFVLAVSLILITGGLLWHRGLTNGTPSWLLAFLFLLAGTTLYGTASGLRLGMDHRAWIPWLDGSLVLVALITSSTAFIQLILDGHRRLQFVDPNGAIALKPFVVITLTLLIAAVNGWFAYDDHRRFRLHSQQPLQPRAQRLSRHLQRMLIAVIAVVTAFFIVELSARFFDRGYALWPLYLGPGLALSPLVVLFTRRVATLPDHPERA